MGAGVPGTEEKSELDMLACVHTAAGRPAGREQGESRGGGGELGGGAE